jgi:hypothetical protein
MTRLYDDRSHDEFLGDPGITIAEALVGVSVGLFTGVLALGVACFVILAVARWLLN